MFLFVWELYFTPQVIVKFLDAFVQIYVFKSFVLCLFLRKVVHVRVVHTHYLYHRNAIFPHIVFNAHIGVRFQEINHISNFAYGAYHLCPAVFFLVLFFSVTLALNIWSIPRASIKKLTSTICKQSNIIFAISSRLAFHITVS